MDYRKGRRYPKQPKDTGKPLSFYMYPIYFGVLFLALIIFMVWYSSFLSR